MVNPSTPSFFFRTLLLIIEDLREKYINNDKLSRHNEWSIYDD